MLLISFDPTRRELRCLDHDYPWFNINGSAEYLLPEHACFHFPSTLSTLIQQIGLSSVFSSAVFGIGIPALFFVAMRKLFKTFELQAQKKREGTPQAPTITPKQVPN